MTVAFAESSPFTGNDSFGEGKSDDAEEIRQAQKVALWHVRSVRALPPYLTVLSPKALVDVDARWSNTCEAMFEFLAAYYPNDLLRMISSDVLSTAGMTFAAEMAGQISSSEAVRSALVPLLGHGSPLVREGAIYGLRDHIDSHVAERLSALARNDPSPAIRQAASDILEEA